MCATKTTGFYSEQIWVSNMQICLRNLTKNYPFVFFFLFVRLFLVHFRFVSFVCLFVCKIYFGLFLLLLRSRIGSIFDRRRTMACLFFCFFVFVYFRQRGISTSMEVVMFCLAFLHIDILHMFHSFLS